MPSYHGKYNMYKEKTLEDLISNYNPKISASTSTSNINDWTTVPAVPAVSSTDANCYGMKDRFPSKKVEKEIKKWLNRELEQHIKTESQKIMSTLEELKKEKESLKLAILALKTQVRDIKKEIREEVKNINEMVEKHAKSIFRYELLDI
ncbi:MAG: hypothetical protein ACTSSP_10140 [Candidatus Asgardarchaeia archaeon]